MGIFRFIFYAVVFYYISKMIQSLFAPSASHQSNKTNRSNPPSPTPSTSAGTPKEKSSTLGEYIEYEEVK